MEYQEFDGIKFYQTSPDDYFRHSVQGTTILMHRYVWEFYNCKIPKGYHVHHIDGNKANNHISNLQLLNGVEHWSLHGKLLTDEEREWRRINIVESAVPKAIEWHKSEDGLEWHKKQATTRKDNRTERHLVCKQCGSDFVIFSNKDKQFCCNACASKYRRASGADLETRTCIVCGNTFKANKYRSGKCCSPSCRVTLGHRSSKLEQETSL